MFHQNIHRFKPLITIAALDDLFMPPHMLCVKNSTSYTHPTVGTGHSFIYVHVIAITVAYILMHYSGLFTYSGITGQGFVFLSMLPEFGGTGDDERTF